MPGVPYAISDGDAIAYEIKQIEMMSKLTGRVGVFAFWCCSQSPFHFVLWYHTPSNAELRLLALFVVPSESLVPDELRLSTCQILVEAPFLQLFLVSF